jgi:hypothetical protein
MKLDRYAGLPAFAGSIVRPNEAVKWAAGSSERRVVPVTASTDLAIGVNGEATAAVDAPLTVYEIGSIREVLAAASVGAGANVAVASSNGGVAPVAAASGVIRAAVGQSVTPAAAGEYFSLYVRPIALSDGGAI